MDLFEAMKERRSVRRFTADPIGDGDLERILKAGCDAPSWANTQCWEVVVVRDPATRAALSETLSEHNPARDAVKNAPVVIVACGRKRASGFKKGEATTVLGDWLMFDVALFLQNATLAAHALGYGTVHVGLFDHAAAARIVGAPDTVQVVELVPLGRPSGPAPKAPPRRPLAELVRYERFRD
ncbi:MAG: nitroreductase family protein [Deltaproteobacteria bacterium]|nr:nitroreductase family protein [Deltaproteobacteria bacterium]